MNACHLPNNFPKLYCLANFAWVFEIWFPRAAIWVLLLYELISKCFLCIWMALTYVNVGMCLLHAKCLVNCLYELEDRISWLVLWWLLYEVMGRILSCYYVLKHVVLRLIKSESFWHSIKIIVILFWDIKSIPNKFEEAALHDF